MKCNYKNGITAIAVTLITLTLGCKKQNEWLDKKPDKSLIVPQTLNDFQAILDNTALFNSTSFSNVGLVGTDNYYLSDAAFSASSQITKNLYYWNKEIWPTNSSIDWNGPFSRIERCNIILESLKKVNHSGTEFNNIKGQALFHRAYAMYILTQLFCQAYNSNANINLGIPLRLSSDVNIIYQRSSLEQTYTQIIGDALESSNLLSNSQNYFRPNKASAYALLAKTYLNKGEYNMSADYSSLCLKINPNLLDFNNTDIVNTSTTYRFPVNVKNNVEILFYAESGGSYNEVSPSTSTKGIIDPTLYQSYEDSDNRKSIFYFGSSPEIKNRGSYTGKQVNFCGIATNEIYLIRAESFARQGKIELALNDLNALLIKRYKIGQFIKKNAKTADEALVLILNERRKELPFVSNIRWEDLKRLNNEPTLHKILQRQINQITYTLNPEDARYVLPIPINEIQISGLLQNER